MIVLRKSFYIHWSAGRSPRVHEVNPGRDFSVVALEKILCSWLFRNTERSIISTCFPCFYNNFMSCIIINSFACTINIEKMSIFLRKTWKTSAINRSFTIYQEPTAQYLHLRKYYAVRSWEIEKDVLLGLVFHVFITTSRLEYTSIALHAPLILKIGPFLLEKNLANKC